MSLIYRTKYYSSCWLFLSLLVVAIDTTTAWGIEVSLETIDEVVTGELTQITPNSVFVKQGEEESELSLDQVLTLGVKSNETSRHQKKAQQGEVRLVDGSLCFHDKWQLGDQAKAIIFANVSVEQRKFTSPKKAIHAWRLPGPISSSELRLWQDLIGSSPVSDLIVIRRRSNGELNPIEGVIEQIEAVGVVFRIGEQTLTVGWDRIFGLMFFHQQLLVSEGPIATLRDNSRFHCDSVFDNNQVLTIRTLAGAELQTDIDLLSEIDYSVGKIFLLSDLPIVLSQWDRPSGVPPQLDFSPRFSRSFDNHRLRLSEADERVPGLLKTVEFDNGVALRSNSQLQLAIPQGMRWLKGKIGIDPVTRQAGSAELVVSLNGTLIDRLAIDGADPAQRIEIPLSDESYERVLTLRVEQGSNRDVGDNVHFVEARVTK